MTPGKYPIKPDFTERLDPTAGPDDELTPEDEEREQADLDALDDLMAEHAEDDDSAS